MKTELSFFGNWEDSSSIGTIRAFIVLIPITISAFIINYNLFPKASLNNKLISSFFIAIFLVSVIGVQNSISLEPTVTYGALSFLVIYSCITISLWLTKKYKIIKLIQSVLIATIFGALNGILIYYTGPTFKYLE